MSKSLNRVFLIGHLGHSPKLRYTNDGTAVAEMSLATTDTIKGEEKTEWHNLVAWGKTAEICDQYLSKGSRIHVEGQLRTRSWEKDGTKRYKTEIHIKDLIMLDGKGESRSENYGDEFEPAGITDDDIPF